MLFGFKYIFPTFCYVSRKFQVADLRDLPANSCGASHYRKWGGFWLCEFEKTLSMLFEMSETNKEQNIVKEVKAKWKITI
ncbi:CLUMA_CG004700, isoform A [Clunio marinus]|uniref:CLUMA_CG004700, isoform A n=1 Tax=Clunio marinus TaxID=568069 RepID=A0A1J1HUG7_9DIPT|nr:CLUMA_CG004700, isoform A [Clunio marinus]